MPPAVVGDWVGLGANSAFKTAARAVVARLVADATRTFGIEVRLGTVSAASWQSPNPETAAAIAEALPIRAASAAIAGDRILMLGGRVHAYLKDSDAMIAQSSSCGVPIVDSFFTGFSLACEVVPAGVSTAPSTPGSISTNSLAISHPSRRARRKFPSRSSRASPASRRRSPPPSPRLVDVAPLRAARGLREAARGDGARARCDWMTSAVKERLFRCRPLAAGARAAGLRIPSLSSGLAGPVSGASGFRGGYDRVRALASTVTLLQAS